MLRMSVPCLYGTYLSYAVLNFLYLFATFIREGGIGRLARMRVSRISTRRDDRFGFGFRTCGFVSLVSPFPFHSAVGSPQAQSESSRRVVVDLNLIIIYPSFGLSTPRRAALLSTGHRLAVGSTLPIGGP